jgi:hypothetical protein
MRPIAVAKQRDAVLLSLRRADTLANLQLYSLHGQVPQPLAVEDPIGVLSEPLQRFPQSTSSGASQALSRALSLALLAHVAAFDHSFSQEHTTSTGACW